MLILNQHGKIIQLTQKFNTLPTVLRVTRAVRKRQNIIISSLSITWIISYCFLIFIHRGYIRVPFWCLYTYSLFHSRFALLKIIFLQYEVPKMRRALLVDRGVRGSES